MLSYYLEYSGLLSVILSMTLVTLFFYILKASFFLVVTKFVKQNLGKVRGEETDLSREHTVPVQKVAQVVLTFLKGKNGPFKECYYGHLKQYKLTKLSPSTKYSLRLAAKNDIGMR